MTDKDVTEPNQSDDDARLESEASDITETADRPLLTAEGTSLRPKRKATSTDVATAQTAKKGRATRKQSEALEGHEHSRRVSPITFVQQSIAELKKVVWPTGDQLRQYFIVVLVFVVLIIAYVAGLDALFGWLLLKLLG